MSQHELMEDDGAGYLISVSDMMSGLLFIFIITLVAFIINFQDAIQRQKEITKTQKEIVHRISNTEQLRNELLLKLKSELDKLNILVEVDSKHGVLRLTENAIQFETGRASLDKLNQSNLLIIGDVLDQTIPCYSNNPPMSLCEGQELYKGKVDSIFIEGHTDNVPMSSGRFKDNWELSAERAITAYRTLIPETRLEGLVNANNLPIFSVSGYGEGRPVEGHGYSYPKSDATNRRIDLRFIMTPPSLTDVQKQIQAEGIK